MARASLNDLNKYSGGGTYFKIDPNTSKTVRFLYNTIEEVVNSALVVHEFSGENFATTTIDCARQDGEALDNCKWCMMGNKPVMRVVLPIYDELTGEISYWKKPGAFVQNSLLPLFENLPVGVPIAGQKFQIKREGTGINTRYSVAPDMRTPNDNRTAESFGDIKDPYDMNMIRPSDYDYDPNASQGQTQQAGFAPRQPQNRAQGIF